MCTYCVNASIVLSILSPDPGSRQSFVVSDSGRIEGQSMRWYV